VTLSFCIPFASNFSSNFEISVEIVFHNFVDSEIRCLVLCGVGNSVNRAGQIRNLSNRRSTLTKNTTKACTQSSLCLNRSQGAGATTILARPTMRQEGCGKTAM